MGHKEGHMLWGKQEEDWSLASRLGGWLKLVKTDSESNGAKVRGSRGEHMGSGEDTLESVGK